MRFAILNTLNNAGLIAALGDNASVIATAGAIKPVDVEPMIVDKINVIAERNVARRRIRFPKLFLLKPIEALYRIVYRRKCINTYRFFVAELEKSGADVALIFNGYLAPNALFELAAQELSMPTLFLENGFFPGTLQADHSGINALSTLPRAPAFYDQIAPRLENDAWPNALVVRASKLKDGKANASRIVLPENFVFVPFQVPSDMQILALSPWIEGMYALHSEVFALAEKFPSLHFVTKEHPSFPISIQPNVQHHPRIQFCNHGNTRELIEASDAVLTVNSTVGLEALTLHKKVITLGDAHYAIDDVTLSAGNREELIRCFEKLHDWQPNTRRRDAFVKFVYNHFLLPIDRAKPNANTVSLLEQRVTKLDSYSDMLQNGRYASTTDKS